jgi:predicted ABC-type sugar transport system permease subunit
MPGIYVVFAVVALALIVLVAVWFYLRRKKAGAAEGHLGASRQAEKLVGLGSVVSELRGLVVRG